jgi:hypothetical protein
MADALANDAKPFDLESDARDGLDGSKDELCNVKLGTGDCIGSSDHFALTDAAAASLLQNEMTKSSTRSVLFLVRSVSVTQRGLSTCVTVKWTKNNSRTRLSIAFSRVPHPVPLRNDHLTESLKRAVDCHQKVNVNEVQFLFVCSTCRKLQPVPTNQTLWNAPHRIG